MTRVTLTFLLSATIALAGCEDSGTRATRGLMVGTWVAEGKEHGGTARRLLVLSGDGRVKESVRLVAPNGASNMEEREGEWSFDGVNFKRKYTYVDGKSLTNAHFIYETYELKTMSNTEMVGLRAVGRGEIRFRRMPAEAGR